MNNEATEATTDISTDNTTTTTMTSAASVPTIAKQTNGFEIISLLTVIFTSMLYKIRRKKRSHK
ncbi:MAG: hypothetical protein ACTSR2_05375 [Candidatus Hodarchaeales archaeon]